MTELVVNATLANDIEVINQPTYALAHNALAGTIGTGIFFNAATGLSAGPNYDVSRGFLSFDTSPLGAGVTLVSGILSLLPVVGGTEADPGHATLHIVEGIHSIPLVVTDFGAILAKIISGGSISEANFYAALPGMAHITLNPTGLGWINKTGITKLALRVAGDIDNLAPTGANSIAIYRMAGALPILTIVYTPAVVIPTVTTDPATLISKVSASTNGLLANDGGEACDVGFQFGLTDAYGLTTPTESKVTGQAFSQPIHGLFPGTTYHFRAFATNSAGTGYGDDMSFTTTPSFSRAHALSREEL